LSPLHPAPRGNTLYLRFRARLQRRGSNERSSLWSACSGRRYLGRLLAALSRFCLYLPGQTNLGISKCGCKKVACAFEAA
jgi:hypothetical protein